MNENEIIILVIIIAIAIIFTIVIYFGFTFTKGKITKKKTDAVFDPTKLIEEESLINSMEEKVNNDFDLSSIETFDKNNTQTNMVKTNTTTENEQINPFGVDLTKTSIDEKDYIEEEKRTQNKFFN